MGRVRSRIRHDFKSGRQRKDRDNRERPVALAVGVAVTVAVAMALLSRSGEEEGAPVVAEKPVVSSEETASGNEAETGSGRTRIPLALPSTKVAADQEPQTESATSETPAETEPELEPAPIVKAPGDEPRAEDAAADSPETLVVEVRNGDSLDRIFRRNDLSVSDLAAMLSIKEAKNSLRKIKPGDLIEIEREARHVVSLTRGLGEEISLRIVADGSRYKTEFITNPVEKRQAVAQNRIETSLFEAGADAELSDPLIMNLAGIFAWDIDFALEIRRGDSFSLLYEEVWQDGEHLRQGDILAAEFVNQGKVYRAVRFVAPDGKVDYYTPDGLNVRKAFLRAPLDFRRVSSNFNPNRLHPILKTRRPHKGVDYAANKGTPVKAAGDGTIILRGRNGGYGNCVIIQHGGNVTTLYAHLSKFAGGRKKGSRVRQGQIIGYVGATGLATAPHLHYEYRLNGVHRNPRTVSLPTAEPVPAKYRDEFMTAARPLLTRLDAMSPTHLAAAD